MIVSKFIKWFLVGVVLIILTACGGGGDDTSNVGDSTNNVIEDSSTNGTTTIDDETTIIGIAYDSQVIGLKYISTSPTGKIQEGLTNIKGEFEYFENGTTKFYVGDIEIGEAISNKLVPITTTAQSETERENIARFLQTIDEDQNPDNGIQIPSTVNENAKNITDFTFDSNFDAIFESYKAQLFQDQASNIVIVTAKQAIEHASISERLLSIQEFDLYKAIANDKNYRGSDYYNADILENDQRKRVYLWLWEKILSKEMDIADDLANEDFDINKVEEERDRYAKYLDYADAAVSISSLGAGTYENITKAGSRTFTYELTQLSSLTVNGCSSVVKLYDITDSQTLADNSICENMMGILNPAGDTQSKLAIINPVLSDFLPQALPVIMKYKKMNYLHLDGKPINMPKLGKADYISLAISIARIANDSVGAYRASKVNENLITRLIAREWLSIWFRSGFNQQYMNKLINNNETTLIGTESQIKALALKWGTSGAFCDTLKFFNPFVTCSDYEDMNFDSALATNITTEYLVKANALYNNVTKSTGSISNEEGEISIGTVEFNNVEGFNPNWSGKITFLDLYNNPLPAPTNAKIRITPDVEQVENDWGGFVVNLNSDGSWITSSYNIDSTHYTSDNTYQFVVFDDANGDNMWDKTEDAYGGFMANNPSYATINDFNGQEIIIGGLTVVDKGVHPNTISMGESFTVYCSLASSPPSDVELKIQFNSGSYIPLEGGVTNFSTNLQADNTLGVGSHIVTFSAFENGTFIRDLETSSLIIE